MDTHRPSPLVDGNPAADQYLAAMAAMRANRMPDATLALLELAARGAETGHRLEDIAPPDARQVLDMAGMPIATHLLFALHAAGFRLVKMPHRPAPRTDLSDREKQVIAWVATGACNKSISRDLGISVSTVKLHLAAAGRKLGLRTRTQLALWVRSQNGAGRQSLKG